MDLISTEKISVSLGYQNLWHERILETLGRIDTPEMKALILDFVYENPDCWAAHSANFEWGELPLMSFSSMDPETGNVRTRVVSLPRKKSPIIPDEVLRAIAEFLFEKIQEDIDETLEAMIGMHSGQEITKPFTSTFITMDIIIERQKAVIRN